MLPYLPSCPAPDPMRPPMDPFEVIAQTDVSPRAADEPKSVNDIVKRRATMAGLADLPDLFPYRLFLVKPKRRTRARADVSAASVRSDHRDCGLISIMLAARSFPSAHNPSQKMTSLRSHEGSAVVSAGVSRGSGTTDLNSAAIVSAAFRGKGPSRMTSSPRSSSFNALKTV